ncbi:60S ribosomal protein L37-like [Zingiber officinale]|uniref:Ribosomal protein L37 n=1 Tax=Zingiber officinale TaxID=94328 RepID=A0A8J5H0G6_ZINOF|nr:60S ribosomal protein L37-like [Zingiber officinale]KAG6514116.1 hypothetical protein ZIOFF_024456 [Zingiber officinale]
MVSNLWKYYFWNAKYLSNPEAILCRACVDNWSAKAITRKTTGIGRMKYLPHMPQRFKNNFREGTEAAPRKKAATV